MLKAVLFDLDGTLLDIDLSAFLTDYFGVLGPVIEEISGAPQASVLRAVMTATNAMCEPHGDRTNQAVFEDVFMSLTGTDLAQPQHARRIAQFYADVFPTLQRDHGPRAGAARAVDTAVNAGLRAVVATNPIFPLPAVLERMRWATLAPERFDLITSYETSCAAKPHPEYFRQIARDLGVEPSECLMVGDDPALDLDAAKVGMRTFYVGARRLVASDWTGDLDDVADLLASGAL